MHNTYLTRLTENLLWVKGLGIQSGKRMRWIQPDGIYTVERKEYSRTQAVMTEVLPKISGGAPNSDFRVWGIVSRNS